MKSLRHHDENVRERDCSQVRSSAVDNCAIICRSRGVNAAAKFPRLFQPVVAVAKKGRSVTVAAGEQAGHRIMPCVCVYGGSLNVQLSDTYIIFGNRETCTLVGAERTLESA